ncbi:hypothetical protein [Alteromonas oceanisediminis]|uniref:hypothetical protein n=1 Tax=Alteromonas oceanisediminis TaxID=2836180 RepID=UPI001BD9EBC2|nr:hypothetical protein [Alteromonas oceanisediminis]MBT0587945.1 hypothetical protein [Alteromonas oceanisediminis]
MICYKQIVKASALYDLLTTAAFALPVVATFKLEFLRSLHMHLQMQGSFPFFEPLHLFFVNLLGCIVIVWAVLRLRYSNPLFGLYDGIARLLFSLTMGYALIYNDVSSLLWFFFVPECIWGFVQLKGYQLHIHYSK